MKIFITGATGFLGKSIIQYLPNHIYYKYVRGSDIINDLNSFSPDIIIHCAAEIYNEDKMVDSNILLTHNILDWIKNNDKRMIYIGSSSEYGKCDRPMSETDVCLPCNTYAFTKYIGTLKCQECARIHGRDICILRPFSVYGPNEPKHRLIPTLYRNLVANKPINLIGGEHDFIHIIDFVNFVDVVINYGPRMMGEIFNVGRGEAFSNIEVLEKLKGIINPPILPSIRVQDIKKACDSETWVCDTSKMENFFKFKFQYTLDSGLRDYYIYKTWQ